MRFTLYFLLTFHLSIAQKNLSGTITDASGKPVPFASIGLCGKSTGTLSGEDGKFSLTAWFKEQDSLKIQAIGFKTQTLPVKNMISREILIRLESEPTMLEEVVVNPKKIKYQVLGTTKYSKNNCTGFVSNDNNWKGSETAIIAGNKDGRTVKLESFSFFIIKNNYSDSILFRLMFYEVSEKGYPRRASFLRKPIFFRVGIKQGEFTLDLKDYNITTSKNFFVSLECLMDEMDIVQFCYAGSYSTPSFVKASPFLPWTRVKGGGADFNIKVSYFK